MKPWVLVTGGALRLGRETCLAFGQAGWNVACHYQQSRDAALQLVQELQALGVQARAVHGSLEDAAQVERLFGEACTAMAGGTLQCVVNNASTFLPDTAQDFEPAQLLRRLQTNLVAPVLLARLLHGEAQRQSLLPGVASVVHILDQKVFNLNPDYFSYTLSKLALERATVQQAQALAPLLRVNAVAPGLIYASGPQTDANFAAASQANLLRQRIAPAQVAQAVRFLAENHCITGMSLCVDNGQHLVALPRDIMFVVEELLSKVSHANT